MRVIYLVLGWTMLGLAFIGALLPLMPSTIFLILAGWFFARSSPRLELWLLDNSRFGPVLRNWRDHGAVSTSAKLMACAGMVMGFFIFWVTGQPAPWLLLLLGAILLACACYITTRPNGPAKLRNMLLPPSPQLRRWRELSFNIFRKMALLEGVTTVALFFVAMPLKYLFGIPEPVSVVGLIHGYAFIGYVVTMIAALAGRGWSFMDWTRTFLASIVPLGTFLNEPFLRRRDKTTVGVS